MASAKEEIFLFLRSALWTMGDPGLKREQKLRTSTFLTICVGTGQRMCLPPPGCRRFCPFCCGPGGGPRHPYPDPPAGGCMAHGKIACGTVPACPLTPYHSDFPFPPLGSVKSRLFPDGHARVCQQHQQHTWSTHM